jgi:two-component system, OmpR family, heavy metal sensor histidine kinase CusS
VRWSIRWRLTLWNAAAMAVLLGSFAVLVYLMFRHVLFEQTEQQLQASLERLRTDPDLSIHPAGRLRYWVSEFKKHQNFSCMVYRSDGTILERTEELPADRLPPKSAGSDSSSWLMQRRADERQQVLVEQVRAGDNEYTVALIAPLGQVDHELDEVLAVLGMAGLMVLLLSALLAYWLARRALAPVDALRRTADAITAERLDRRLAVPNPRDELGQLAQTINAMIVRLERSFAEIRRFTADASHELRTPVAVIRAEAEVALAHLPDPDGCRQLLGSIVEECGRLGRLTDQLLTLARQDAGHAKRLEERIDLAEVAGEVVETLRPLADVKGLRLETEMEADVNVAGDPNQVRQVFINLVDNAIKYTPSGGTVTARVVRRQALVVVTVQDTGEGIAAAHLPHIFERFYRVDKARSREMGGSGLGLSIVRSIVEAHGGTVAITSQVGQGSTFTVTLPLLQGSISQS